MTVRQMSETTSYLLAHTAKAHRSYANELLEAVGLHVGQEMILLCLWGEDGLTQSQLAERLAVKLPTVSRMLSRMEKAALIERCADSQDNRVSRVYLTEKGRDMETAVACAWGHLEACTVANLTVDEQILLRRLLRQVHNNLLKRSE